MPSFAQILLAAAVASIALAGGSNVEAGEHQGAQDGVSTDSAASQFKAGAQRIGEGAEHLGEGIKEGAIATWEAIRSGASATAEKLQAKGKAPPKKDRSGDEPR